MALRPPRAGFSVARRLSERARAEREAPSDAAQTGVAGVEGMMDALRGLVERLVETGKGAADAAESSTAAKGERSFNIGGKEARMVFGYTLKMGEEGVSAERFGDVPEAPTAPKAAATPTARQPIAEVFEDGEEIIVVAELPGADPSQIVCKAEGLQLLIEAGGARRYRKTLALPAAVTADGMQTGFQNGILEVRLRREGLQ